MYFKGNFKNEHRTRIDSQYGSTLFPDRCFPGQNQYYLPVGA